MSDIIDQKLTIQDLRRQLLESQDLSWGKDHEQRLRKLENAIARMVGYETPKTN
jgi:hypothetical protein